MIILGLLIVPIAYGQTGDKCAQVLQVLDKVKEACQAYPPQDYCNVFVGEATHVIYGIDDFVSPGSPTGYYQANTIAELLMTDLSTRWDNIGNCNDPNALKTAQLDANSNRCVIAIWRNNGSSGGGHGHVSLILPGNLMLSSSWGLSVPNAANFSLGGDTNNYVCDKLSKAFSKEKIKDVLLYVHKD